MGNQRHEIFMEKKIEKSEVPTSVLLSKEKYDELVRSVLKCKVEGKRDDKDYCWLSKHYDVIEA